MKLCECGCGQEVKLGNRFVLGHNNRGIKLSEETKQKIRGFKHTDKTKRKMSKVRSGRKFSDTHKEKIALANIGKNLGYKHTPEALEKLSGENASNWQGGISFGKYCPKFNNSVKEGVRDKYGRICFLCGKPEDNNGRRLDVHHVNYDKTCLCSDIKCEFVPLCQHCHGKTSNGDREYYEELILERLEELS